MTIQTATQTRILTMIADAHARLRAEGFDQKQGQDGIYKRNPTRIVGSEVFGYNDRKEKRVVRVMYPKGWSEAIGRETAELNRLAHLNESEPPLDDDEPPL